jgi:arabinogalactan endo-1,4-beta-galactosidase
MDSPTPRAAPSPKLTASAYDGAMSTQGKGWALWALVAISIAGLARPASAGDEFWVGADISGLSDIEKAGATFRDAGKQGDAIAILRDHGFNLFRVRLFVHPDTDFARSNGATQDLDAVRALARRIKSSGAAFLLDLHYADTWADPAHQPKPAEWQDLPFDALEQKVHDYTADVLSSLRQNGTPPDMVQIGNEIAAGILWPDGQLDGKTEPDKQRQWDRFARLVKSGCRAAREAGPKDHPARIVIHIHGGGREGLPKWFFENLSRHDVDYDIIGLSFYPRWDDSFDALKDNLDLLARTYNKDIVIMETAYAYRGTSSKPTMRWPLTPAGQSQFVTDLIAAVRAVPERRGRGVVWWYPESIPLPGRHVWEGGSMALFDEKGDALPALGAFVSK